MGKYIFKTFLFTVFLFGIATAQTEIVGHLHNQDNKPLPFASVVLFQDSIILIRTIADKNGNFAITSPFKIGSHYTINISLIGYQLSNKHFIYPDTDFVKNIELITDKNILNNVTITADKPLITRKSDRYIVNVENSFLANGNSGLEVLEKVPGLWSDNDGSIHIKGNAPVTVMINDVVQRMAQEDLKEYLKTLKSEDISKIEIISNPPSEYEAQGSGGIVHIMLKKARKDGLNGSINSQYKQQSTKPYYSAGASLNYKIRYIYLFGNYSFNKDIKPITDASQLIFNGNRFYNNSTARIDNYFRQQYRFGIAFDIFKRQTFSLQTSLNTSTFKQFFNTSITDKTDNLIITGITNANRQRYVSFASNTFNYLYQLDTTGSTLKIIGDYSTNAKTETSKFNEYYSDVAKNTNYRNIAPNSIHIYSIQADLTKSFKNKTALKAGAKYVAIERDNEIIKDDSVNNSWINNIAASDHFIYNENVMMLYASLEKQIHQTNIKIGLRGEETESKGNSISTNQQFAKHYVGLFPSFYISQLLNETKGNMLYLNYSRRLTRPTLSDLNPNRLQYSSNTAMVGNPNLLPQFTHNIEVGANWLNKYSASLYFTKTTNIITLVAYSDSNNFINYRSANLNNSTEYGINVNAPFKITKNWSANNSLEANNLTYTFNRDIVHQTTYSIRLVNTITIKNIVDIDAIINYRSATRYSNIASPGTFYFNMGFTKKIIHKQGTLRLYITDVSNSIYEKEFTYEPNVYIYFYRKQPTRTANLSFTYNFSVGKKFMEKKVEQGGNDMRSRIGN